MPKRPTRRPGPRRPSPPPDPLDQFQQMMMDRVLEGMDNIMNRVFAETFPPQSTFTPIMTPQPKVKPRSYKPPKPQPSITTLYSILQVHESASPEVITGAWRSLCKLYHPDVVKGHDKKMREINAAYEVLSDPDKRKLYDNHLRSQQR